MSMSELWQYATTDVENFGDVLYPILLRQFMEHDGQPLGGVYGFTAGDAPLRAPFKVEAIRSLFSGDLCKRRLIIGGGDILRTDDEAVARHYSTVRVEAAPTSLAELLARQQSTPAQRFREQYMPPGIGAFLLSPAQCSSIEATAYFSVGVPFEFQAHERDRICAVLDAARHIYLRDEISAQKLRNAGVARDLDIAPDFAIGVERFFPASSLRKRAEELLTASQLVADQSYLCFQCSAASLPFWRLILEQLQAFAAADSLQIALLPLGPCHYDPIVLSKIETESGGRFKIVPATSVEDMLAILAHATLFAGVSMHGNICARSYGVPHLFGPLLGVDKIEGAMQMLDVHPMQRIRDWRELAVALRNLRHFDRSAIAASARSAFDRSGAATRRMLDALVM